MAEYFDNKSLSGVPVTSRCESSIDYDWGDGSPSGARVGPDDFSVRWTGTHSFASAGDYTFTTRSDDGVRLKLDGATTLIDNWTVHPPTTDTATTTVSTGDHQVTVEYFENAGGAVARASWAQN